MKETVMKGTVAVLGASIVSYFGTLAAPLLVLLFVMIVDYVTGMVKAYMAAQLSSKIGLRGILKKLCYMAMVAVGAAIDYLLGSALVQVGIDMHVELFCGMLVAIWLIINELISILENLAVIGVPGFPALTKLIDRLRNTVGNSADENDDKR